MEMLRRYFDDANGRFGGAAWLQARHSHTTSGEQLLVHVIARRSFHYRTTLYGAFTTGMHYITHWRIRYYFRWVPLDGTTIYLRGVGTLLKKGV